MVQHHGEYVFVRADPGQQPAHARTGGQIERSRHPADDPAAYGPVRIVGHGGVEALQLDRAGGDDLLGRPAIVVREPRPQALLVGYQPVDGGRQRGFVEVAAQPSGHHDVVGRIVGL